MDKLSRFIDYTNSISSSRVDLLSSELDYHATSELVFAAILSQPGNTARRKPKNTHIHVLCISHDNALIIKLYILFTHIVLKFS